jgi:uncharacterized protein YvpB
MTSRSAVWQGLIAIFLAMAILAATLAGFYIVSHAGLRISKVSAAYFSSPSPSATIQLPTPTFTSTSTITRTPFQPLPTDTPSPTPTSTSTPTPTSSPTSTPLPTRTFTPTRKPKPTKPPKTPTATLPSEATVDGVTGHPQLYNLDCEARSAVDLASFFGTDINEKDFLRKLPKSDNPETGFVGNYRDPKGQLPPDSYGVYAEPVAKLLRKYGIKAHASKDLSFERLQAEIASGRPVMAWVIGNVWQGYAVEYVTPDGMTVIVANFEHTVIVTGYDESSVSVIDGDLSYQRPLDEFLASWAVLQNMAIIVEP